jgi:hypothetical protein
MMIGAAVVSRKMAPQPAEDREAAPRREELPAYQPERYPAPVERRVETREPVWLEPSNGRE